MDIIAGDVVDCEFNDDKEDSLEMDTPKQIRRIRNWNLSLISAFLKRKRAGKR